MTAFDKMKAGEWTDVSSPEIAGPNNRAATLMRAFNATGMTYRTTCWWPATPRG